MLFLTLGDVLVIHRIATELPDSYEPIFDVGLLESAIMRPQQSLMGQDAYPDIHHKAAALMHSLCRNHAFVDGNKRTALLAVATFYALNGLSLRVDDAEIVGLVIDVAEGLLDVPSIVGELKGLVHAQN